MLIAAALGLASPAYAADELPDRYLPTRLSLCDTTACYVVWGALDSDADGVSNADEAAAGTDPYDPARRPGLGRLRELAEKRVLPGFEAGMGAFLLVPAEILAFREKAGLKIDGAGFPMPERRDALSRLGLSASLLTELGIDPDRDGMTIGLGAKPGADGLPARAAGTIAYSVTAGSAAGGKAGGWVRRGGVAGVDRSGTTVTTRYQDGSWSKETYERESPALSHMDFYDEGDRLEEQSTRETRTDYRPDGGSDTHTETRTTGADGGSLGTTVTDTHVEPDGSSTTTTTGDDPATTTTTGDDGEGTSSSSSSGAGPVGDDDENGGYWDPDAAPPAVVTQADVDGVLVLRGAAVTTVAGWTPPGLGGAPKSPRDPGAIGLFDTDAAGAYHVVVDPLRVTRAQPEVRGGGIDPIWGPPREGGCGRLC
jgi:hypothetical protein